MLVSSLEDIHIIAEEGPAGRNNCGMTYEEREEVLDLIILGVRRITGDVIASIRFRGDQHDDNIYEVFQSSGTPESEDMTGSRARDVSGATCGNTDQTTK